MDISGLNLFKILQCVYIENQIGKVEIQSKNKSLTVESNFQALFSYIGTDHFYQMLFPFLHFCDLPDDRRPLCSSYIIRSPTVVITLPASFSNSHFFAHLNFIVRFISVS